MPDIPNVPGVPSLTSYSPNNVALLTADAVDVITGLLSPGWGIFPSGTSTAGLGFVQSLVGNQAFGFALGGQAFPYNSIVDFDYKQDWPISDYQLEDGGFQSYDKVQLPFDVRVRVASGNNEPARQGLISAVTTAANKLSLFDVVTPEQTYKNCCITHVDYDRKADKGNGVILMDIWFVEIRITATSTSTTTQSPTVAGQQNTGSVAPSAFPSGGASPIAFIG